jgi:hypothetical protein
MRRGSVGLWWVIGRPGEVWGARRKDAGQARSSVAPVVVPWCPWNRARAAERVGLVGTVHGGRSGVVVTCTVPGTGESAI